MHRILNMQFFAVRRWTWAGYRETRILDPDVLKRHVIAVQTKAYTLHGFPCIRSFEFANDSPLHADCWNIGHELFQSTSDSFPVFLEPGAPVAVPELPPLTSLTCLTPLRGHVSVIHISLALGGLLSPLPGSVILGCHVSQRWKGLGERLRVSSVVGRRMFCHSPGSWRELWEAVFPEGNIKVDANLERRAHDSPDGAF
ncbi:hypothetical protein DFH07DRAFT_870196 [Mycena maculata]|uniref:Uncharacterized protein n=1 Tax=Mycena maculata TaxID=230809 RepID=A0AAD7IDX8_9AGAR|nr:hypothetical protein DFH07DRAFT_870196 [Mycena maculata]